MNEFFEYCGTSKCASETPLATVNDIQSMEWILIHVPMDEWREKKNYRNTSYRMYGGSKAIRCHSSNKFSMKKKIRWRCWRFSWNYPKIGRNFTFSLSLALFSLVCYPQDSFYRCGECWNFIIEKNDYILKQKCTWVVSYDWFGHYEKQSSQMVLPFWLTVNNPIYKY